MQRERRVVLVFQPACGWVLVGQVHDPAGGWITDAYMVLSSEHYGFEDLDEIVSLITNVCPDCAVVVREGKCSWCDESH